MRPLVVDLVEDLLEAGGNPVYFFISSKGHCGPIVRLQDTFGVYEGKPARAVLVVTRANFSDEHYLVAHPFLETAVLKDRGTSWLLAVERS